MRSELNRDVPVAAPHEFRAARLGSLIVDPPVVLAPMAGVTNAPFRTLCRRFSQSRCRYVSEMITARAMIGGHRRTLQLAAFGAEEDTGRSIQLYGTNPEDLATAARLLVQEHGVEHIDINLGCPAPKVTANGGGSAIPVRPRLMARLVAAVVTAAAPAPVTVKFRKGIDDELLTYLQAGRIAEDVGCVAVGLHARTAAQLYAGAADWNAIARLKQAVSIPVLGNGDVFEAFDALRMMRQTGCDGVIVGRGCLGRPWLFRDLVDVFDGREPQTPPDSGQIAEIAWVHARLLSDHFGEHTAVLHMRKHMTWYTKSFAGLGPFRARFMAATDLNALWSVLQELPRDLAFPREGLRVRRGKDGHTQKVRLPRDFLADRDNDRLYDVVDDPALDGG